uniref:Uncharacterized protein n=1 Tax=Lotharella globosa TaxID=91324 RepID=A0A7S3Z5Z9_9EUKA
MTSTTLATLFAVDSELFRYPGPTLGMSLCSVRDPRYSLNSLIFSLWVFFMFFSISNASLLALARRKFFSLSVIPSGSFIESFPSSCFCFFSITLVASSASLVSFFLFFFFFFLKISIAKSTRVKQNATTQNITLTFQIL